MSFPNYYASLKHRLANGVDLEEMPQNVASRQGLHILLS